MQAVAMTWQQATLLAAGLGATSVLLQFDGRRLRLAALVREAGYVAGLYALWQLVGSFATATSGAYQRGSWIVGVERTWHLPSEVDVQRVLFGHPLLAQACNLYYALMHFTALFALLLWLLFRHRDRYGQVRTTIALVTGGCLLLQFVPVAPPRLLPNLGFVDVAEQYGQSVYGRFGVGADQLSAMPSVHVAWAVLIGLAVVGIGTGPWRWLVLGHPLVTIFVVVATGNHFWLDGIVAVAVLALVLAGQTAARRAVAARRQRAVTPAAAVLVPVAESGPD